MKNKKIEQELFIYGPDNPISVFKESISEWIDSNSLVRVEKDLLMDIASFAHGNISKDVNDIFIGLDIKNNNYLVFKSVNGKFSLIKAKFDDLEYKGVNLDKEVTILNLYVSNIKGKQVRR